MVDQGRESVSSGGLVTTTSTGADEDTGWLTDQGTLSPQASSSVPEGLPLSWEVTESGWNTEQESVVFLQGVVGGNWDVWLWWSVHLVQDFSRQGLRNLEKVGFTTSRFDTLLDF